MNSCDAHCFAFFWNHFTIPPKREIINEVNESRNVNFSMMKKNQMKRAGWLDRKYRIFIMIAARNTIKCKQSNTIHFAATECVCFK